MNTSQPTDMNMNTFSDMPRRPHEPLTDDSIHSTVRAYLSRGTTDAWKPIGTWDVSQVTNMSNLFRNTGFNESLNDWDTSHVTDMSFMFHECIAFNQPVAFDTSRVTDMHFMFNECTSFNQPVLLNTSRVTNTRYMFSICRVFNQSVVFDTSRVTNMSAMFYQCTAFNQPVVFDTSRVTDMSLMFEMCTAFNQPVLLNTSRVTDMSLMFEMCTAFNQPVVFDTSRVTNMRLMFKMCTAFNQPVVFDTSQVTDMSFMFYGCTSFNQPVVFDTSQVTNMRFTFLRCAAFNQLVTFDTSQVTDMRGMFCECSSLAHRPVFTNHNPQAIENGVFYDTPLPPVPTPGAAFEVHNVFNRINMRRLLELIRVAEHIDTGNYAQPAFGEHVDQKLRGFIVNNVSEDKRANVLNSYNRLSLQIKHFTFTNTSTSRANGVVHTISFGTIINSVIAFVETRPSELIATYMETFVNDCVTAYAMGPTISCAHGIIERLVSSLGNLAGITDVNNPAIKQLYINLAREVGGVDEANPGASVLPAQVSHLAANCINEIKTSLLAVDEANMAERRRLLRNCILEKLGLPVTTESPAITAYLTSADDVLSNEFLEGLGGEG